ncbi:MAG: serine/threonine-protein kinase [Myxococcota bacterium]
MEETEFGDTLLGETDATGRNSSSSEPVRLLKGDSLGRYVVLDVLGSGGMGVVYAAYDPELERRVAIKLLRPALIGSIDTSKGRGRLMREAQALARLQHPNVITVHDVGEHEGQVFVAMEFIDGVTFQQWLRSENRSWREIVAVMREAGRGLHAAHVKDMVHRDFKPDNLMIEPSEGGGPPRRILVMDFGLATPTGSQTGIDPEISSQVSTSSLTSSEFLANLTRTGAVMGTPAYMAPEQHAGRPTDSRSDQFAFCVTLYEALYGQRPFPADSLPALVAAVTRGEFQSVPAGSRVPRWLREIVVRGLAPKPADRWPSLADLDDALSRDPTRTRRRIVAVGLGLAGIGAVYGSNLVVERQRLAECRRSAAAIDEVWNDEVRQQTREGMLETGLSYAPSTWAHLEPRLDERAQQWKDLRYESCAEPNSVPPSLHARQDECFDTTLTMLRGELRLLAEADAAVLNRAIQAVTARFRVTPCADPAQLRHRMPLPDDPELAERVAQIRARLEQASNLRASGHFKDALALLEDNLPEARALEHKHLLASALVRQGRTLYAIGRYDDAAAQLEEGFFVARAAGADALASYAARVLVELVGHDLAQHTQGRRWARHAEILANAAALDEVQHARIELNLGTLEFGAGNYKEALERMSSALEVFRRVLGDDSSRTSDTLKTMAVVHDRLGEPVRATENLELVLTRYKESYGLDHPETGSAHNDLAAALLNIGEYERAREHLERSVEIFDTAGLDGKLGAPLDNLVLVSRVTGRLDEGLKISDRALAIRRKTLPTDHPDIGNALINRGQTLATMGDMKAAIDNYEEALGVYERSLGKDHARIADAVYTLALPVGELGDHERALALHERGLKIRRVTLPDAHSSVAWSVLGVAMEAHYVGRHDLILREAAPLVDTINDGALLPEDGRGALMMLVGEAYLASDQAQTALPWMQRAKEMASRSEQMPTNQAEIDFALARALWATDTDRERAKALVRDALKLLGTADFVQPGQVEQLEQWLQEHP